MTQKRRGALGGTTGGIARSDIGLGRVQVLDVFEAEPTLLVVQAIGGVGTLAHVEVSLRPLRDLLASRVVFLLT